MRKCLFVFIAFAVIVALVLYIVYLCNLHARVSRLENRAAPHLEIIEREVHGIGFYLRIIVSIAIFFCVGICVHYVAVFYPRFTTIDDHKSYVSSIGVDYWGVIVGFMALLVTLLVGWNIYSTIKAREELKSFETIESHFRGELNKHKQDVTKECSEVRKQIIDLHIKVYTELLLTTPLYLSAHKEDFERLKEALDVYKSSKPENLIANMLAKEFSLGILRLINATPNKEARQNAILRIKKECDNRAISKLYAEYLDYSDETKAKYSGVNDIFLELLKD